MMTDNQTAHIRRFDRNDRKEVRRIGCETAFMGDPLCFCFEDREILADALTLYYTDYEPESCFVAAHEGRVIGYVTVTRNAARMQRIFKTRIVARLCVKAIIRGTLFRRNTQRFLLHVAVSLLRGEFSSSDFLKQYPATLHINIDRSFRERDIGTQLMERCFQFLRNERIVGVHVSTMSEGAKSFFEKLGFSLLLQGTRSFLRYCLGRDLPFYILGKKL